MRLSRKGCSGQSRALWCPVTARHIWRVTQYAEHANLAGFLHTVVQECL